MGAELEAWALAGSPPLSESLHGLEILSEKGKQNENKIVRNQNCQKSDSSEIRIVRNQNCEKLELSDIRFVRNQICQNCEKSIGFIMIPQI